MESSFDLLAKAQRGDRTALNQLIERYRKELCSWAHLRLPRGARSLRETEDIVQEALVRALNHIDTFELRHEGALLAYLRLAVLNRIRDEIRRVARHPKKVELDVEKPGHDADPLAQLLASETFGQYEAALVALDAEQREAVILRVEFGKSNQEIAAILGKPSMDAARMFVARAILRLAEAMRAVRPPSP